MRSDFLMDVVRITSISIALAMIVASDLAAEQQEKQTPEVAASASGPAHFKVTLLGTGTHGPRPDRFGPSTLVEAGSEKLVFDCGRGCPIRLQQKGVRIGEVKLFVTHLHSDHVNGIVDLWLTGWFRRTTPFVMIGPEGTKNMAVHLEEAFMPDIRIRMAEEKLQRDGVRFDARDITPGIVYEANGV